MLSPTGDCTACSDSLETAWDGAFNLTEYGCNSPYSAVNWRPEESQGDLSIDGKELYYFVQVGYYQTYYMHYVSCWDTTGEVDFTIWQGYKLVGATPAGTYDWDTGCDTTSTLTVVEASCAS
jgi:hypothetical protein